MSEIIQFPKNATSVFNPRRVTVDQYANLSIYDVYTKDNCRGLYIEGFRSDQEAADFLHDLDEFFIGSTTK